MINVARISNGLVENIEYVEEEWLMESGLTGDATLVRIDPDGTAHIGLAWNPTDGFEQPSIKYLDPEDQPLEFRSHGLAPVVPSSDVDAIFDRQ